jgi:RNA polymerase sigma factor (sigma-70 family)
VSPLIHYLKSMAIASGSIALSDSQLLHRFVASSDETAFAVLVQRHGPLVLGICSRLLQHEQDAEDAFQATFLVLASKAETIRRRTSLASWLHGVAERVARKARRTQARRRERAMPLPEVATPEATPDLFWRDLRLVLDQEIARLPERYREPFVLCYLQGQTNAEAAQLLGCPKGTVLSRLARARAHLARRLRTRDIALPAAALTTVLTGDTLCAAVSSKLADSTAGLATLLKTGQALPASASSQVFALTTGGMTKMSWTKTSVVVATVLTGALLTTTLWGQRPLAPPVAPSPETATEAKLAPAAVKEDKKEKTSVQEILRRWTEADQRVRESHWRFERTINDRTFGQKIVSKGQTSIKKPDLFRVDIQNKDGGMEEILLGESGRLHRFDFRQKCEHIGSLPKDLSLGLLHPEGYRPARRTTKILFIFEINWEMLNQEFSWTVLGPQPRTLPSLFDVHLVKEDRWYLYLEITPKDSEDKKSLKHARVVLDRDSYQVRQHWWELPNDNSVCIDYLDRQTNPQPPITRESLLKGLPTKGWKRQDVSGEAEKKSEPPK